MNISYSSLLTKAWNITWKYKVLWFFGFLAALGGAGWGNSSGGSGPNFNFNFNSGTSSSNYRQGVYPRGDIPKEWQSAFDQLAKIDVNTWITVGVVAVCSLLLLGLVFWLLSIIGRGGLIGGILAADANGKVTFREAWDTGTRNFWRLFLIRLLTCGLGFIPMVCVSIIIGMVLKAWFAFMDYAVVAEKRGVGEAIGRSWTILRDNIGPAAILYIILFGVSLGVGLGLLILFAPAGVTIFLSLLPLITASGSVNTSALVTGIVLFVLFVVAAWIVQAVLTVFETAVMVFGYREFARKSPLPVAAPADQPQITA